MDGRGTKVEMALARLMERHAITSEEKAAAIARMSIALKARRAVEDFDAGEDDDDVQTRGEA
jgi:hypothetical protein